MTAPVPPRSDVLRARRKAGALTLLRKPSAIFHLLLDGGAPKVPQLVAWAALLYLVVPVDVVPDAIPILGWLDDLGIVAAALAFVSRSAIEHEEQRSLPRVPDATPVPATQALAQRHPG